ncbi:MAG: hypothetical protein IKL86_05425 [Clostridia bacterium]|nr:hypothetical protein [Clostridia bacterium]
MRKINYNLLFKLLLIAMLTFFAGFFLPKNLISNAFSIFEVLLVVFGVALTLFTFIQGVVQNCKNNFLSSVNKGKDYLLDKFNGLDEIVKELKGDVFNLLIILLGFGFVALFFGQIENVVWQEVFNYLKYLVIFLNVFLIFDLVMTMFKLIEINAELNKIAIKDKEDKI